MANTVVDKMTYISNIKSDDCSLEILDVKINGNGENNVNVTLPIPTTTPVANSQQIQNAFLAMQQLTQMQAQHQAQTQAQAHAQAHAHAQAQAQAQAAQSVPTQGQAPAPVGNLAMFQNTFAPLQQVQVPVSVQPAAPVGVGATVGNNVNVNGTSDNTVNSYADHNHNLVV